MKKVKVYRLEHKKTKLGPFVHQNQIPELINKGLNNTLDIMEDIDSLPEVINILKDYPNAIFAFLSLEKCTQFIRNMTIIEKHGFIIKTYLVTPLYISKDNQVIFCRD